MPLQRAAVGDAWLHEVKIDGWRCQLIKEGRRIHFFSRSGNDLHRRLGSFARLPEPGCEVRDNRWQLGG